MLGMSGMLSPFLIHQPSGFAAAEMTLRLVGGKELFYRQIQSPIAVLEGSGQILVNGGFADSEMGGGASHRGVVLQHIFGELFGSVFAVVRHLFTSFGMMLYLMSRQGKNEYFVDFLP